METSIYFKEKHMMVRKEVRNFIKYEIAPYVNQWEEKGVIPLHKLFKKMGRLGFLGIRYNKKWGGEELDFWYETIILEEISRIKCGGIPMAIAVQMCMATPAIHEFGSDYLKNKYLKPAIKGEMVSAIAITEPNTGSDVSAIKTTAIKDGNDYILNGTKTFITNGTQADFVTILARTSNGLGYKAFSLFVVPTHLHGFSIGKKFDKLGMRSSDTTELYFDDVRIPSKNLIGREGEGFKQQMKQFQHERFFVLVMSYITSSELIKSTIGYLKKREAFGEPLIKKQVLRHRISKWLSKIECLRQFSYHIVRMKIDGKDPTKEVSMGKLIGGSLINEVTSGCLQMYGGTGFMNESYVSRAYRDYRLISIGAGTSEIMCDIIAKLEGF